MGDGGSRCILVVSACSVLTTVKIAYRRSFSSVFDASEKPSCSTFLVVLHLMSMDRLSFIALTLLLLKVSLFSPPGALPVVAQTSSCNQSSLTGLAPCLPYIEPGNTTNPASDCCQPLGSIMTTQPTCMCQLGPLAKQLGLSVNLTRALEVASICQLTIPTSVSSCLSSIISAPTAAPSTSIPTSVPPPTSGSSPGSSGAGAVLQSSFAAGALIAFICAQLLL